MECNLRAADLLRRVSTSGALAEFGLLLEKADAFDPIESQGGAVTVSMQIYQKVWPEAETLRSNGKLLEYVKALDCPVTVIHGDYDPHPFEGVQAPLESVLSDCNWIVLEKCGHKPWIERAAKDMFYQTLRWVLGKFRPLGRVKQEEFCEISI